MRNELFVLVGLCVMTVGCAESVTMAGNGVSMVVACLLLWSTINLGRHQSDHDQRE